MLLLGRANLEDTVNEPANSAAKAIAFQYLFHGAMMALAFGMSFYLLDDGRSLAFVKALATALYLLAGRGVAGLCPIDHSNHIFSGPYLERLFLDAALLSGWLVIFLWNPAQSLGSVIISFVTFAPIYVAITVLSRWLRSALP